MNEGAQAQFVGAAAARTVCGTEWRIITDLPDRLGVLSGEADLLAVHLADWLASMLAGNDGRLSTDGVTTPRRAEPNASADDRRT